jgi:16S rRNA (cytosine1402-N4)-methyltransferase
MSDDDAAESGTTSRHVPVLLAEVVEALEPAAGKTIVDGTFGAGGYTRALLDRGAHVIAVDRDPSAIAAGRAMVAEFAGRLTLVEGRFSDMERHVEAAGCAAVDGIVLDIGVSSMQLDETERGFSFMGSAPLDMRMSATGPTAAELVATLAEEQLADVIYHYGEERRSRAIARAIVRERTERPIATTADLVRVVSKVLGQRKIDGRHPATRTFQALRIAVNDELGELARALFAAERLLAPGGRLAVVTFHSLEDRIVKRFLQSRSGREVAGSRHLPPAAAPPPVGFQIVNHRPITPGPDEVARNPRARSAKLRVAIRSAAPPLAPDLEDLGLPPVTLV